MTLLRRGPLGDNARHAGSVHHLTEHIGGPGQLLRRPVTGQSAVCRWWFHGSWEVVVGAGVRLSTVTPKPNTGMRFCGVQMAPVERRCY